MKKTSSMTFTILIVLAIAFCLASCAQSTPSAEETNVPAVEEPTATVVEPTPTSAPAHPAAGLIFSNAQGTWRISRQGEPELVIDRERAVFSPDQQQLIYTEEDPATILADLWVMNVETGERRNITQTPDRYEASPAWLPGETDALVFGSDTEGGMSNAMFPTMVQLDGSGYQILDEEVGGYRGLSPQGAQIVYGGYEGTALISAVGSEPEVFDPDDYGISVDKLFLPAWSPDEQMLAWFAGGDFENTGGYQLAIVVFDLIAQRATLLHHYAPAGGSMFIENLAWSPDGAWLAFTTHGEPPASGRAPNLWVIRPDGSDETYIGEGAVPVWRYDSQLLAFQGLNESETEEVFLVEADSWEVTRFDAPGLPERIAFLLDWLEP